MVEGTTDWELGGGLLRDEAATVAVEHCEHGPSWQPWQPTVEHMCIFHRRPPALHRRAAPSQADVPSCIPTHNTSESQSWVNPDNVVLGKRDR